MIQKLSHNNRHENQTQWRRRRGFTLIELLLVLAILVIIGALVVPNFFSTQRDAERQAVRAQIGLLENALQLYRLHMGDYPSGDEGLEGLYQSPDDDLATRWKGPYLEESALVDPWGRPYEFQYPPQNHQQKPDIWSLGPDGEDGTEDDVTNWLLEGEL